MTIFCFFHVETNKRVGTQNRGPVIRADSGLCVLLRPHAAACCSKVFRPGLVLKNFKIFCHIEFAAHTWSIKFRRKQKLITQFVCKPRDESFDPN